MKGDAAEMSDVGGGSLRGLPSTLLSAETEALGPEVALREFADPPRTEFLLPPGDAIAVVLVTRGHYVLGSGRASVRTHALMGPGSSAVTPPGKEVHAGWNSASTTLFRSLHLHASGALLARTADELGRTAARDPDYLERGDEFVSAVMRQLMLDVHRSAPRLHLDTLVQSLLRHLLLEHNEPESVAPRALSSRALRDVVELMQEHLHLPLTLDELARAVHLSPFHFLRRFRATTGRTPTRFLTLMRMERAKVLLAEGDLPVHDVAAQCGYTDPSAFTAAFRRATGRTPSAFRLHGSG